MVAIDNTEDTSMGDIWDYKLKKTEMAWELALRLIPTHALETGEWTKANYLKHAQEVLQESYDVIEAVFKPISG